MANSNKLTVGIISYNRPVQLLRTLKSLLPLPLDVEVIICDDKSPKIFEIINSISEILNNKNIHFIQNEINIGYDKNLFNVIERSNTDNVLLLGDDDYLETNALENLLRFLSNTKNFKCGYLRFKGVSDNKYNRFHLTDRYNDKAIIKSNGSYLYNSILFSGLIFNKTETISYKDILLKYFNSIYIQVAIFLLLHSKYGSYGISGPGIIIGGDGESGFGFNDASSNLDADLKDRTSIISNLAYHKRLFDVVKKIEEDICLEISSAFIFEYKIRSVKAIYIARKYGRKSLANYWKSLKKIDTNGFWMITPFYLLIYFSPLFILKWPISIIEVMILKYRKNKQIS
jgi:hypothetical protein